MAISTVARTWTRVYAAQRRRRVGRVRRSPGFYDAHQCFNSLARPARGWYISAARSDRSRSGASGKETVMADTLDDRTPGKDAVRGGATFALAAQPLSPPDLERERGATPLPLEAGPPAAACPSPPPPPTPRPTPGKTTAHSGGQPPWSREECSGGAVSFSIA